MKKGRIISLTVSLLLAVSMLVGCSSTSSSTSATTAAAQTETKAETQAETQAAASTSEPVEIAIITTSLTGSLATNGEYIMNGVNMALEEVMAAGGINGAELKVTFLDDQVKASEAINAAKKAVSEINVPVILGPDNSGNVLACMSVAAEAGVPQIVSGTNVKVTSQGIGTIFRMRASDKTAASCLAELVKKDGYTKIAFMYTNEDYGKGFMESTKTYLDEMGIEVAASETCNIGDTDFTAQITTIKNAAPEAILVLGKEIETAKFIRQARETGLSLQMYGGSPLGADYVVELATADALEGTKIVTHFLPANPDEAVTKFVETYESKYGNEPTTLSTAYYDSIKMVAQIMNEYGTTKEDIIKGLKEIDYVGVQSHFHADETGEMVTKQVVGEFKDGKWSVIDSIGN